MFKEVGQEVQNGDCWKNSGTQPEAPSKKDLNGIMYKSKRRIPDSNDHLVEAASFIISSVDFIVYDVKGYILCYS